MLPSWITCLSSAVFAEFTKNQHCLHSVSKALEGHPLRSLFLQAYIEYTLSSDSLNLSRTLFEKCENDNLGQMTYITCFIVERHTLVTRYFDHHPPPPTSSACLCKRWKKNVWSLTQKWDNNHIILPLIPFNVIFCHRHLLCDTRAILFSSLGRVQCRCIMWNE